MGEQQSSLSAPRPVAAAAAAAAAEEPPSPAGSPREPGSDEPPEAVPSGGEAGPGRSGEPPPNAERREDEEEAAGPEEPPALTEEGPGPEGGNGHRHPPGRPVYCTVYCVENDRAAAAAAALASPRGGGPGAEQPPASRGMASGGERLSSGGSIEVVDLYLLPEPFSGLMAGEFGPLLVLSCRVCLEEKPIKPLSCCKKAVCEECLKRYLSSQVGPGTSCFGGGTHTRGL